MVLASVDACSIFSVRSSTTASLSLSLCHFSFCFCSCVSLYSRVWIRIFFLSTLSVRFAATVAASVAAVAVSCRIWFDGCHRIMANPFHVVHNLLISILQFQHVSCWRCCCCRHPSSPLSLSLFARAKCEMYVVATWHNTFVRMRSKSMHKQIPNAECSFFSILAVTTMAAAVVMAAMQPTDDMAVSKPKTNIRISTPVTISHLWLWKCGREWESERATYI